MLRSTSLSPAEVVDAVKEYSVSNDWLYMGASTARQGEVTMVKFCIQQVGQVLWPPGLQLSGLLPRGNVGVYQKWACTKRRGKPRFQCSALPACRFFIRIRRLKRPSLLPRRYSQKCSTLSPNKPTCQDLP